jgi:hypothetical protein
MVYIIINISAFCTTKCCKNCIRKKRKSKGKFLGICDNCEDKYLCGVVMKA